MEIPGISVNLATMYKVAMWLIYHVHFMITHSCSKFYMTIIITKYLLLKFLFICMYQTRLMYQHHITNYTHPMIIMIAYTSLQIISLYYKSNTNPDFM